jgi:hypothetical protein
MMRRMEVWLHFSANSRRWSVNARSGGWGPPPKDRKLLVKKMELGMLDFIKHAMLLPR